MKNKQISSLPVKNELVNIVGPSDLIDSVDKNPYLTTGIVNGEPVLFVNIDTPISSFDNYVKYPHTTGTIQDILQIQDEDFDWYKDSLKIYLDDKEFAIKLTSNNFDDLYFLIYINKIPVKCYLNSSEEQLTKVIQVFLHSIGKIENKLYYKKPLVKLMLSLRKPNSLQFIKNYMSTFSFGFKNEDQKIIQAIHKEKIYNCEINGNIEMSPENLKVFCKNYNYAICYNAINNTATIINLNNNNHNQLQMQVDLKRDLKKEGFDLKNFNENLLIFAVLNYKENVEVNRVFLGDTNLIIDVEVEGEDTTDHSTSLSDEVIDCFEFDNVGDRENFKEAFPMMILDVIKKVANVFNYGLMDSQPNNKQFFYTIIADELFEISKMLSCVFESISPSILQVYNNDEFKKLLNHKLRSDYTVCYYPHISEFSDKSILDSYLTKVSVETKITSTYNDHIDKYTVLVGGLENGDLLKIDINDTILMRFSTVNYDKLQQIDWIAYCQYLINYHKTKKFFSNDKKDIIKAQFRTKAEVLDTGIVLALGKIINTYELLHKNHEKQTYSPKQIMENFDFADDINTAKNQKVLSKLLRRVKHLKEVRTKGFKLSKSIFTIDFEEHLTNCDL